MADGEDRTRAYARVAGQWGFLHAVPEGWPGNRLDRLRRQGAPLGVQPVAEDRLVEAFFRMGPTKITAGREEPQEWVDILAFAVCTGLIALREVEILREMSKAYLSANIEGRHPLAIPPAESAEPLVRCA